MSTGCSTGRPSFCPSVLWKKSSRATRWQSGLELMSPSSAGTLGADTGHGVPIGVERLGRSKLPLMPSTATKKNPLSFFKGPPSVPPNCSRWKPSSWLPSERSPVRAFSRWKWNRLPWSSLVPDLVMTFTTPPAVRPNSAVAPLATTWNSFTASRVMSIAARWPPTCSPKKPLL